MPTIVIPTAAGSGGNVARINMGGENWAVIIAGGGTFCAPFVSFIGIGITPHVVLGKWVMNGRCIFSIDTSVLGATATITSAILNLDGGGDGTDPPGILPTLNLYGATPASATPGDLVAADYSQVGAIPLCNAPINFLDVHWHSTHNMVLNAAGIAAINKTGITAFSIRNTNYDVSGVDPIDHSGGADPGASASFWLAGFTTLTITYTLPSPTPLNIKAAYPLSRRKL